MAKILVSQHKSCTYKLVECTTVSLKPQPSLNVISKSLLPSLSLKGQDLKFAENQREIIWISAHRASQTHTVIVIKSIL